MRGLRRQSEHMRAPAAQALSAAEKKALHAAVLLSNLVRKAGLRGEARRFIGNLFVDPVLAALHGALPLMEQR